MKQKTHAIIALMSVILYFIFLIIYYLICNIFSLQGGDDFVDENVNVIVRVEVEPWTAVNVFPILD